VKRLFIAFVAAVPVLLAGVVGAAQGHEAATTQTVTPPSKITICHKTGSDSNPWRRITVSSRAWMNPNSKSGHVVGGHIRHTGDVIVVGTAACPSPTATPAVTNTPATKITICHKTGSTTNPYRRITVSSRAWTNPSSPAGKTLRGHARHTGDMLLAGAATCPSGAQTGHGTKLSANLQPVPGATGSGSATVTIRLGVLNLCYTLTVSGLGEVPTAAHIHRASNNAIVVPLTTPTTGTSSGCDTVEKALLQEIVQNPTAFYVNVHTATWPNGQVQGKLSK
jgi:CHRD domain